MWSYQAGTASELRGPNSLLRWFADSCQVKHNLAKQPDVRDFWLEISHIRLVKLKAKPVSVTRAGNDSHKLPLKMSQADGEDKGMKWD